MNIVDTIDIAIPSIAEKVEFFTVDPDTLSFVRFGEEISGGNRFGKVLPLYVLTQENIAELSISVSTSSNVEGKLIVGPGTFLDFSGVANNNTVEVTSVLSNVPVRLSLFFSVSDADWEVGEIEFGWSY